MLVRPTCQSRTPAETGRLVCVLAVPVPPTCRPPAAPTPPPPLQAKAKIMVVKDVEREDIEFISKTLHCLPIAHVDHMRAEKLGQAALVEETDVRRPAALCSLLRAALCAACCAFVCCLLCFWRWRRRQT